MTREQKIAAIKNALRGDVDRLQELLGVMKPTKIVFLFRNAAEQLVTETGKAYTVKPGNTHIDFNKAM